MKRRNRDLFEGISGYIAEEPGNARLLIGPFRNDPRGEYIRGRPCVGSH